MTVRQDLRYAARVMRRQLGLTAVIVLTLALAIGANTAIFSIMDAVLLQPLPVRDPQSLMLLEWSAHKSPFHSSSSYGDCDQEHGAGGCSFSMPFYQELSQHAQSLQSITASAGANEYNLSGAGQASIMVAQAVAGNYFSVLGVGPARGRMLTPSDDAAASPLVLVLNYQYWQSAFAGRPDVVGQTVEINNTTVTIVGVAEPRFVSLTPGLEYDGWLPLSALPRLTPHWRAGRNDPDSIYLTLFARLRPGVRLAQARAEVSGRFRNALLNSGGSGGSPLAKAGDDPRATMVPAQTGLAGARAFITAPLTILLWTVGLILLMACANVAGLLLGRASARQKEMALRRALGARPRRILRQLMTESVLLSAMGGGLGLGVGWLGARALLELVSSADPRPTGLQAALDARVLLFALAASLATGILFGLAPALRAARGDLQRSLKDGVGNSAGMGARRRLYLGNGLVVAQVALCMMVLAGAGLLVRSLANLRSVNPGFDTSHVLLFTLEPELIGYKGAAVDRLYQVIQERVGALPGVRGVSYSENPLLSGDLSSDDYHIVPGGPKQQADVLPVGLNFFNTMKLPMKLGRDFVPSDFVPESEAPEAASKTAKKAAPEAIIVNEAFVRKYLGAGNPIGRVFGIGDQGASGGWKIVGVAGNARYQTLRDSIAPTVYTPSSEGYATFEVRTAADPMASLAPVRQVVHAIDANLPLSQVSTQARNVDQTLFGERLMAYLSGCFGALALLLACIGLYGLLSQEVTRRTREIGIRMALGGRRGQVLRMVLGFGAALGVTGLALGMAGAWGVTRYLQAMLFGVGATDPVTLASVALLLFLVSLGACLIPALRAIRVNPLEALRYE